MRERLTSLLSLASTVYKPARLAGMAEACNGRIEADERPQAREGRRQESATFEGPEVNSTVLFIVCEMDEVLLNVSVAWEDFVALLERVSPERHPALDRPSQPQQRRQAFVPSSTTKHQHILGRQVDLQVFVQSAWRDGESVVSLPRCPRDWLAFRGEDDFKIPWILLELPMSQTNNKTLSQGPLQERVKANTHHSPPTSLLPSKQTIASRGTPPSMSCSSAARPRAPPPTTAIRVRGRRGMGSDRCDMRGESRSATSLG